MPFSRTRTADEELESVPLSPLTTFDEGYNPATLGTGPSPLVLRLMPPALLVQTMLGEVPVQVANAGTVHPAANKSPAASRFVREITLFNISSPRTARAKEFTKSLGDETGRRRSLGRIFFL
jgi:hypothetical protein